MKTHTNPGRLVAELRKIIGKSQSQFASMIGVSKHSIISVENGRTKQLTKNLTKRIEIATGAELRAGKLESPFRVSDYTRDDFKRWRDKYGKTDKAAALKQFNEMKAWVKILFLAAAKAGRAGNRDRLPVVCLSLAEWLHEARENFKLEDDIEDVLDEATLGMWTEAHFIPALLADPAQAKKVLAPHGIAFNKIKKELNKHLASGVLLIQDEYRGTWNPGGPSYKVLCADRTRSPQAKYWIMEFQGSWANFEKYGSTHPELRDYLERINAEKPLSLHSE